MVGLRRKGARSARLLVLAVAMALAMLSTGSAAKAGTVYELEAVIVHGNGAVDAEYITSGRAGDWSFTVEISGQVTDLFVQLWYPQKRNSCADNQVGSTRYTSGSKRSYLSEGVYSDTFDSPYTGKHCARIIIWGKPGATAKAKVAPPADPAAVPQLPLL